jgi:uncharacterized protein YabN with tetrapyrrole methylase and pyrophosphatase domain
MSEELKKSVEEIKQEIKELTESREELLKIKKQMTEAGFSEDQAIRRIAEAVGLDFRSVKNWLRKQSHLQHQNLLKVILFLKSWSEIK